MIVQCDNTKGGTKNTPNKNTQQKHTSLETCVFYKRHHIQALTEYSYFLSFFQFKYQDFLYLFIFYYIF